LAEHIRFIDYALDYCDLTDDYPDAARFRWTCESSWGVSEFLNNRPPAQIEKFKRRVREGRIEVTGMIFNMSEIADENLLSASLLPLKQFKGLGIPVTTAMQNDVNGIAWCLADFFPEAGIKYLNMGQHGHRARIPFDKPTAFWWESPSGGRVLAFRADHYMIGNNWGIHTGKFPTIETELMQYLKDLDAKNYPHNRIAVHRPSGDATLLKNGTRNTNGQSCGVQRLRNFLNISRKTIPKILMFIALPGPTGGRMGLALPHVRQLRHVLLKQSLWQTRDFSPCPGF
jgi:hypothetical protein